MLPEHLATFMALHRIAAQVTQTGEAAATADAAARLLGFAVSDNVKTMVLTDGTRFVASIVPGDKRLDRRKVAQTIGSGTLRFASAAEVAERTGYPAGGVAPFGFVSELTVIVDASLAQTAEREVVAGGGRPELLMRVSVADLIRHNSATVASIVQDEKPA